MAWHPPLPLKLHPSAHPRSFAWMPPGWTTLPIGDHPGAFAVERKHHVHEGVDLYAPDGTPVFCVEDGTVVKIEPFTGPQAGTPWWHDTQAVFVEGASGVVVYGEIEPGRGLSEGMVVEAGQTLGRVRQVLRVDKGRPMSMLHIELHAHGTREAPAWEAGAPRPATLQDPTPFLRLTKQARS